MTEDELIPFEGKNVKLKLVGGATIRCYLKSVGYQGVTVMIGSGGAKGVFYFSEIHAVKRRWF